VLVCALAPTSLQLVRPNRNQAATVIVVLRDIGEVVEVMDLDSAHKISSRLTVQALIQA
jgi:hypothetical protein